MYSKSFLFVIFSFLCVYVCAQKTAYHDEIEQWKQERLTELKSENGWLNLAGLFWIKEGKQYFGGSAADDIRFPIPSFPAQVGYFERNGNIVKQVIQKNIALLTNGVFQKEQLVFHADSLQQPQMSFAHYRWTLLQRDELIGIRFRDLKHPAVEALKTIPCFPIDTLFRVKAKLVTPLIPIKIPVANVLGQITQQFSPGKLVFNLKGETYSVDALQEGNKLFIVFGDRTSGQSTYASGRYLYAAMPGEDGITILDFNKAFNPPCVFTAYATCLLPPTQNILRTAVEAGEKMVGDH
jgi:uncharacterized protein (DUF1684 family)